MYFMYYYARNIMSLHRTPAYKETTVLNNSSANHHEPLNAGKTTNKFLWTKHKVFYPYTYFFYNNKKQRATKHQNKQTNFITPLKRDVSAWHNDSDFLHSHQLLATGRYQSHGQSWWLKIGQLYWPVMAEILSGKTCCSDYLMWHWVWNYKKCGVSNTD